MTVEAEAIDVGPTPVALNVAEGAGSDPVTLAVRNNGAATVYVGGSDVDTADGFPIAAGATFALPALEAGERAYAVVADTGTDEVQELEIDATGGTFPVTFDGDTTDPELDFDAPAEDVAAAVIAASDSLEEGDLEVTGGPGDAGGNTPYVFTFASRLGNVGQITSSGSNLTGRRSDSGCRGRGSRGAGASPDGSLGPRRYEATIGGQPQAVGAWSELLFTADGKVTVRPTTDGTAEGDPLFSRLVGGSFLVLTSGGLLGAGADDDPTTGPAVATIVAQEYVGGGVGLLSLTLEVSTFGDGEPAEAVADSQIVFATIFGIPS